MTEMYFLRYSLHRLPVQSRKHVLDKEWIHLEFDLFQFCFLGIDALCKYTNGPTGPAFKQLQRKKVCPDGQKTCIVWDVLVQRDLDG